MGIISVPTLPPVPQLTNAITGVAVEAATKAMGAIEGVQKKAVELVIGNIVGTRAIALILGIILLTIGFAAMAFGSDKVKETVTTAAKAAIAA